MENLDKSWNFILNGYFQVRKSPYKNEISKVLEKSWKFEQKKIAFTQSFK